MVRKNLSYSSTKKCPFNKTHEDGVFLISNDFSFFLSINCFRYPSTGRFSKSYFFTNSSRMKMGSTLMSSPTLRCYQEDSLQSHRDQDHPTANSRKRTKGIIFCRVDNRSCSQGSGTHGKAERHYRQGLQHKRIFGAIPQRTHPKKSQVHL